MELLIDSREIKLLEVLDKDQNGKDQDNSKIKKSLVIGDIIISKNGDPYLIFERKTVNDLYSSVISGRYNEQRTRLLKYRAETGAKIVYIIEGKHTLKGPRDNKIKGIVNGCIENLALYYDISVLETKDVGDTADMLKRIFSKLKKTPLEEKSVNLSCVAPQTRKENLNDNLLAHQLALIPGVSMTTAAKIAQKYFNMNQLMTEFKESPDLFINISLGKRKLGKALNDRIYKSLFG